MKNKIVKNGVLNALGTAVYIILVSTFLFYIPKIFDSEKPDTLFAPVAMISLLVFSVALVGSLLFGRPILWYWDGQKKEAVSLIIWTLIAFFLITLIVLAILFSVLQ